MIKVYHATYINFISRKNVESVNTVNYLNVRVYNYVSHEPSFKYHSFETVERASKIAFIFV